MKNVILAGLISFVVVACSPRAYMAPNMAEVVSRHKTVAILPPKLSISMTPRMAKKMKEGQLQRIEREMSDSVQKSLYKWMARKRKKDNYSVSYQDVRTTNSLLAAAGIGPEDLKETSPDVLARVLGVDGLITMYIQTSKPISDGAAAALQVAGFMSTTNSSRATISVVDGASGTLLWRNAYADGGYLGSSSDHVVFQIMQKAARQFPYHKRRASRHTTGR